jgi:FMN-dependent NADH-azoreductase
MASKGGSKSSGGGGHSRSAKTGRYVTRKYAQQHPATTVTENDKRGGKK